MTKPRTTYTREFKLAILAQINSGVSVAQVARENGEMRVRGVEARRHDTPDFIRKVQLDLLDILAHAEDAKGFQGRIPICLGRAREYGHKLTQGKVDPKDLVFTKSVSKDLPEYRTLNEQAACLYQLEREGINTSPGQKIRYLVTDSNSSDPARKVRPAWFMEEGMRYDTSYYLKVLSRSVESLLLPFGWTQERVMGELVA